MDIRQTIGKRIHRLRRQMDMTQQGLAEKIGVNASYIGPLEKGLKCPSITVLQKLAQELNQPVFSFFLDDRPDVRHEGDGDRLMALLASHSPDERRFILRMVEEMSTLLKSRRSGSAPFNELLTDRQEMEVQFSSDGPSQKEGPTR
jgi:transcriptional regulator with XRE-family HTH domain